MQRLPYNGAPRAHKLRHNVISSSLFNERWQHAAHTFYPGVLAVGLISLSLSLSPSPSSYLFHDVLFGAPPSSSPRTCCEPCVALCCQVAVSNVIHLLIEPSRAAPSRAEPRVPTLTLRFTDRDIISSARMRYLRCQSSFLYYVCARVICIIRMTAVFAFTHYDYASIFRNVYTVVSWISIPMDYRVVVSYPIKN